MSGRLTLSSAPFAGRTGRGVRVAIVDSGIAAGHPHVGAVASGVSLLENAADASDYRDRLGHGTAVAGAIREKAPDIELIAVRIFDRELKASGDVLARAIRWAADHGAQLVNLSLGTPNEERRELLSGAMEYATARGAIVIAAAEHNAAPMYPGALEGAVGVLLDPNCAREEVVLLGALAGTVRIAASGYPRPIPGVPPERNISGLSFAVANATGFLARLIEGDDVRAWLAARAIVSDSG
ncbi:MAG: S8 family serine peptidase [Gemmatimonadaceae bacterium]